MPDATGRLSCADRYLIVLNPTAGALDPGRLRRMLGGAFAHRQLPFDLVQTERAKHAEEIAREGAELGYRAVVAVGGDGTLAEVVTGLAGSDVPLGIIPQGTANQVALNLGISDNVERAVDIIAGGHTQPMDLGRLDDGSYFALIAGAGWDARVMALATREMKDRWGFGAYLYAGIRESLAPPSARYRITADGETIEVEASTVLVANVGEILTGLIPVGVKLGPKISVRDGLLDVCIFAAKSIPDIAAVLWRVASRQFAGDERMLYLQAKEVTIEADPPVVTQVDGDPHGETPLTLRAVPDAVRVLVGE
jgi:diacylglycerol kinase (ATP)